MSANFSITCWGCNKSVSNSFLDDQDFDNKILALKTEGWFRRNFGENASPWFCGDDCAYNSYHAKRAEEWWDQHNKDQEFKEICEKSIIHPKYYGLLGIMFIAAAILFVSLIGSC